ncbi:MAG: tyrosine-type recombinase/integrase [Nannocystaceae bacterium]
MRPANRGRIEPFSAWAIRLLMLTGLRKSEVLGLEWPMVDWQHSCFHLPETKRGQRTVLVSDEVITLLREIASAYNNPRTGLVIRGRNDTKLTGLNYTWNSLRQAAGIPDVRGMWQAVSASRRDAWTG